MRHWIICGAAATMLLSSCSDEPASTGAATVTTAGPAPSEPLDTLPPPGPDPADVEWATSVTDVVNVMQGARTEAIFLFNERLGSIARTYDVLVERFEAEAVAVDLAVDSLPPTPTEATEISAPYADMVTATAALSRATDAALAELREREPELRTDDREKLSPALQQVIDQHAASVAAWQSTCFAVQNALVELTEGIMDCVGIAPSDDSGDDATAATPTTAAGSSDGDAAADVEADLECVRGASSDDLPFDTAPYDFLNPARGRWILSRLTIQNNSAERVQLAAGFRVRWYDEDGATLATTLWPEGYKPALTARAGQTIVRTGLGFEDVRGLGGEELSPELIDLVFGESAGCELLAPLTFTTIDDDAFL
ncbi:MAG: hypothetical protein HKN41_04585, partial [Ilumatobacter sp.]|nr:hypothetical protein [Ilumatobacter sp.]